MTRRANPYHLAGPFGGATALVAIGSARGSGRDPRPEARASLIADLTTAGLSAAAAFTVLELAEGLHPEQYIFSALDRMLEQARSTLAIGLETEQVHAFELGAALTLAHAAGVARWDAPEEGRARLQADLGRANLLAQQLGVGEADVARLLRDARADGLPLAVLAGEIQRVSQVLLDTMLRG